MKCNYKYKGLAEKIKEILQKNFPKNKDLTDVKSALLDDDDFINELTIWLICLQKMKYVV